METRNPLPLPLLFICSTNISLSPLIQAVFANQTQTDQVSHLFLVSSAGSHAGKTPRPIDRKTCEFAAQHGLDLSQHMSRTVTANDIAVSRLIITMNEDNFWHIKDLLPSADSNKLRMLMEFSGQLGLREMPDPLLGEISYAEAYEELCKASRHLLDYCMSSFDLKCSRSPA